MSDGQGGAERARGPDGEKIGIDYYALLNIPRTATRDEVKTAYARLAKTLHPDKQPQQFGTADVNDLFILVDKAYKVLSDDEKRRVYDDYGIAGIDALGDILEEKHAQEEEVRKAMIRNKGSFLTDGEDENERDVSSMQVSLYDYKGANLRQKVIDRIALKSEISELQRFHVRGALMTSFDATDMVHGTLEMDPHLAFNPPIFTVLVVQQSVDIPLSEKDTLSTSSYVVTRNGMGNGNATIALKRDFSKLTSAQCTVTVNPISSRQPSIVSYVSLKGSRSLTQHNKGAVEFVYRNGETGANLELSRSLSNTTTGAIVYGFGSESGVALQLNRQQQFREATGWTKRHQERRTRIVSSRKLRKELGQPPSGFGASRLVEWEAQEDADDEEVRNDPTRDSISDLLFSIMHAGIQVGPSGFGIDASVNRSFTSSSRAKAALRLSTSSAEAELSAGRSFGPHSKANMSLSIGVQGVTMKLKYERGGGRFVIPLLLSSQVTPSVVLFGSITPMLCVYAIRRLLNPLRRRMEASHRLAVHQRILADRTQAKLQMSLMKHASAIRCRKEAKMSGLVVLRARYGTALGCECSWDDNTAKATLDRLLQEEVSDDDDDDETNQTKGVLERFMEWIKYARGPRARTPSDWEQDESPERKETVAEEEVRKLKSMLIPAELPNIDVTLQLNYFVRNSQLHLPVSSKANMLGFYNPCYGLDFTEPELYIRYSFQGLVYEILVPDTEDVHLPSPRAVLVGSIEDHVDWEKR